MFSGLFRIRIAFSADDGKSWSSLEPIGDFGRMELYFLQLS